MSLQRHINHKKILFCHLCYMTPLHMYYIGLKMRIIHKLELQTLISACRCTNFSVQTTVLYNFETAKWVSVKYIYLEKLILQHYS